MAIYKFHEVKVIGIDGKPFAQKADEEPPHKVFASIIFYNCAKDVKLTRVARRIYASDSIELDSKEAATIRELLMDEKTPIAAFIKDAYSSYMTAVEEERHASDK